MQRLFSLGIAGMLIVVLLAACGGDDDDAVTATATSAGSAATATSAPASGGAPTATSAPANPTPSSAPAEPTATNTTAPPTATSAPEPTATEVEATPTIAEPTVPSGSTDAEARLFDLLLTQEEVGDEWVEQFRRVVEGDGSDGICGTPPFPRRNEKLAHVEAQWQTADGNKLATENIVDFPEDVLQDAMDYVHAAFNCTEWTDALGTVSTVAPWDDPALDSLGDDRQAAIVTIPSGSLMVDLYVIFVRTGNLITQLGYADVLTDPATAASDAAEFVRMAIEKVEAGM